MFVGDDSWSFVDIMKIDAEGFINRPIEEWPLYEEYKRAKSIVDNLCVVNNTAERSVRLVSDFLSSARKEETLQNILQVVEREKEENILVSRPCDLQSSFQEVTSKIVQVTHIACSYQNACIYCKYIIS